MEEIPHSCIHIHSICWLNSAAFGSAMDGAKPSEVVLERGVVTQAEKPPESRHLVGLPDLTLCEADLN